MLAGGQADDVVGPRQGHVGEGRIQGRQPPAPGPRQDRARLLGQGRVEAVARHIEQDRDEAVEGVAAHEHAQARPVVKVHDTERDIEQLVFGNLEQLVAGVALQHILQPALVVTADGLAGPGHDIGRLLPDQRHLGGRLVVGLGGEQADEAHLAHRAAVGPVPLDPDVVHVGAPVHAGDGVGLGHHQGLGGVDHLAQGGGQHRRLVVAAQDPPVGVAQHAQAALGLEQGLLMRPSPVLGARVFVDARAQEHEMVGLQPAQQGYGLGLVRPGRRAALQLRQGAAHQAEHGREVLHRRIDVIEGALHLAQGGLALVLVQRVHQHADHRPVAVLVRHHGMQHGADRQALGDQLAHHAVHQEGPVALHDLQQVQAQGPSALAARFGHADGRLLGMRVGGAVGPQVRRQGREIGCGQGRQVARGVVLAELEDEILLRGGRGLSFGLGEGLGQDVVRKRPGLGGGADGLSAFVRHGVLSPYRGQTLCRFSRGSTTSS